MSSPAERAPVPDPARLQGALDRMRVPVDVTAEGRLALLAARESGWTPDADARARVAAAARDAGFSHVALALDGAAPGAAPSDSAPPGSSPDTMSDATPPEAPDRPGPPLSPEPPRTSGPSGPCP